MIDGAERVNDLQALIEKIGDLLVREDEDIAMDDALGLLIECQAALGAEAVRAEHLERLAAGSGLTHDDGWEER